MDTPVTNNRTSGNLIYNLKWCIFLNSSGKNRDYYNLSSTLGKYDMLTYKYKKNAKTCDYKFFLDS